MNKTTKPFKTNNSKPVGESIPFPPEFGEYNGKPTIILRRSADDKYPFQFGKAKAKLIVAHIEAIRAFSESMC